MAIKQEPTERNKRTCLYERHEKLGAFMSPFAGFMMPIMYSNITDEHVASDSEKWEQTVQPIIGDCDIILYPNGSDIAGIGKYTFDNAKFKTLYEDGYRYFYNVDSHVAWQQLGEDYFRGGRRNLDGYRMWHTPKKLADLFDVSEVFDPDRPTPVPSI